jgi:hypothetical protein
MGTVGGCLFTVIAVTMAKREHDKTVKCQKSIVDRSALSVKIGVILRCGVRKEALEGVGCHVTCAEKVRQRSSSLAWR